MAVTVPADAFDSAEQWLQERVELLALAAEGRVWFPTADLVATATPRRVAVTGVGGGPSSLRLGSTSLQVAL